MVSHGCQSPLHPNSVATLPVVARHFSFLQKQLFSTSPLPSSFCPHHLFLFSHRKWEQPYRDFFNLLFNDSPSNMFICGFNFSPMSKPEMILDLLEDNSF